VGAKEKRELRAPGEFKVTARLQKAAFTYSRRGFSLEKETYRKKGRSGKKEEQWSCSKLRIVKP